MALGKKTGGRVAGTPNKATATTREAFQAFVDKNVPRMEAMWLEVAAKDPAKAFDLVLRVAEFCLPKLQRSDVTATVGVKSTVSPLVPSTPETVLAAYHSLRDTKA